MRAAAGQLARGTMPPRGNRRAMTSDRTASCAAKRQATQSKGSSPDADRTRDNLLAASRRRTDPQSPKRTGRVSESSSSGTPPVHRGVTPERRDAPRHRGRYYRSGANSDRAGYRPQPLPESRVLTCPNLSGYSCATRLRGCFKLISAVFLRQSIPMARLGRFTRSSRFRLTRITSARACSKRSL